MKVIRQAANNSGDCVIVWRLYLGAEIHYQVVLCNSRTEHTLKAYSTAIAVGAFGRKHLEKAAQIEGLAVFEEACGFMGLNIEEEE